MVSRVPTALPHVFDDIKIFQERHLYHSGKKDDLSSGQRSDWRTKDAAKASVPDFLI